MFDIGPAELLVLVVAAVLLFGPEKLPDLARKAARVIAYVRNIANNAQAQISTELGPGFENFDIRDPKGSIRRHILDQVDPIMAEVKDEIAETKKTFEDTTDDFASVHDDLLELTAGSGAHDPVPEDADVDVDVEPVERPRGGSTRYVPTAEREPAADAEPVLAGAPFDPDAT